MSAAELAAAETAPCVNVSGKAALHAVKARLRANDPALHAVTAVGYASLALADARGQSFLDLVGRNTTLRRLRLERTPFSALRLARALAHNTTLEALELELASGVPAAGRGAVLDAVRAAAALRELRLAAFVSESDSALVQAQLAGGVARLLRSGPLEAFAYTGNRAHLDAPTVVLAAQAVQQAGVLRRLDLSDNRLTRDAVAALAGLLRADAPLAALVLARCELDSHGVAALGRALRDNTHLRRLVLNGNLSPASEPADAPPVPNPLAVVAENAHAVEGLDLSYCSVRNPTLPAILHAVCARTALRALDLRTYDLTVTDAVAPYLTRIVRKNRTVTQLNVVGLILSPPEQKRFVRCLRHNPVLRELWLEDEPASPNPGAPPVSSADVAYARSWMARNWDNDLLHVMGFLLRRNYALQWRFVSPMLLGVCMALLPMQLPPYVVLHILDFLPDVKLVQHALKADLVTGVCHSYHRVLVERHCAVSCTAFDGELRSAYNSDADEPVSAPTSLRGALVNDDDDDGTAAAAAAATDADDANDDDCSDSASWSPSQLRRKLTRNSARLSRTLHQRLLPKAKRKDPV